MKKIDIICIGEVLIDFIGHEVNKPIHKTKDFHRYLGGSPTNVAVNGARLGLNTLLVATCGEDGLGDYVIRKLKSNRVDISCVKRSENLPTSVIFVSKSTETPDFIPFREADSEINLEQLPDNILEKGKIFHTTCFALSKNPAQQTILNRAKRAKELGLKLSIDLNFSDRIWHNKDQAKEVIKSYLSNDPLVKISEDDCSRLFNEVKSIDYIFDYIHSLGVSTICLTRGKNGVILSDIEKGVFNQKALKIDKVKDATGAGDAFWTGFLYAQINNKDIESSVTIAQKLASIKLQNIGKLPKKIDFNFLMDVY